MKLEVMCKRQEIIDSARSLFTEYGYKKVTMDEIANNANVTKKTIYHYFKDKNELFEYFITEELEKIKDKFEKQLAKKSTFSKRISLGVKEILDFKKNSPLIASLTKEQKLNGTTYSKFLSHYDDEIINYLDLKIEDEIKKGTIKKCNTKLTAFIIYKVFSSIIFEYKDKLEEKEIIKEISSILQNGLVKGG